MIRPAQSLQDIGHVIELVQDFLKETSYPQALEASRDREHIGRLVFRIRQHGYIWLAQDGDLVQGLLMAVREPNMWAPSQHQLRELIWYVRPQYRSTSVGGRLFLEYCRQGDQLIESGQIQGYFTTRMTTTRPIDLERRGFRLTEQIYVKEK